MENPKEHGPELVVQDLLPLDEKMEMFTAAIDQVQVICGKKSHRTWQVLDGSQNGLTVHARTGSTCGPFKE